MPELPPILRRSGEPDRSPEAVIRAIYRTDDPMPSDPDETQDEFRKRLYDKQCREIFREALRMQTRTLDDTLAQRVAIAWRITRELARLRGLIASDETLMAVSEEDWEYPKDGFRPNMSARVFDSRVWEPFDKAKYHDEPGFGRIHPTRGEVFGIALCPPPIPSALEEEDDYNYTLDPQFGYWLETIRCIGSYLRLGIDPKDNEYLARDGYFPLIDPLLCRAAWPGQQQVEIFEELLVEEVVGLLAEEPQRTVAKTLRNKYGLTEFEIDCALKMARASALKLVTGDVEEDRGLMVMRLEALMKRARDSFDLRTELGALKQLSIILGLSRTDRDDTMKDIMEVIADAAKERKALMEPKPVENLAYGHQGEIIETEIIDR